MKRALGVAALALWLLAMCPAPALSAPSLRMHGITEWCWHWTDTPLVYLHYGAMSDSQWLLRMKDRGDRSWSPWRNYGTEGPNDCCNSHERCWSWRIPKGEGRHKVYLCYKRESGSTRYIVSSTVRLDATAPQKKTLRIGALVGGDPPVIEVSASYSGSDNMSPRLMGAMCVGLLDSTGALVFWGDEWRGEWVRVGERGEVGGSVDPTPPAGTYTANVYFSLYDRAGNEWATKRTLQITVPAP